MRKTQTKPHYRRRSTAPNSSLSWEEKFARLEAKFDQTVKAARAVEARLHKRIRELELEIKQKDLRIEELEKTNAYLTKKLFGEQSEKNVVKSKKTAPEKSSKKKENADNKRGQRGMDALRVV
jgi:hypothetical protein